MKITKIDGEMAMAEVAGIKREIGLQLVENPKVGDYVIVHVGFAIQILDEEEALETLSLLQEFGIQGM